MKKHSRLKPNQSSNHFRIVAGTHRGRVLTFPDAEGLRPTPDRVRETVFNWLQLVISGARCLDLFSGSGALGIEACSRGASQVTCVDINSAAVKNLKENSAKLQLNQLSIIQAEAVSLIRDYKKGPDNPLHNTGPFDIIFLDPPYSLELLPKLISAISSTKLVAEGGLVYLEHNKPLEHLELPEFWELKKHKKAGQVYYGICEIQKNLKH